MKFLLLIVFMMSNGFVDAPIDYPPSCPKGMNGPFELNPVGRETYFKCSELMLSYMLSLLDENQIKILNVTLEDEESMIWKITYLDNFSQNY